jgi:hypothetical protein
LALVARGDDDDLVILGQGLDAVDSAELRLDALVIGRVIKTIKENLGLATFTLEDVFEVIRKEAVPFERGVFNLVDELDEMSGAVGQHIINVYSYAHRNLRVNAKPAGL